MLSRRMEFRHVVGGVDTHKDLHVAAVVDERDLVLGNEMLRHHPPRLPADARLDAIVGQLRRVGIEFNRQPWRWPAPLRSDRRVPVWKSRRRTIRIGGGAARTTISMRRTRRMRPSPVSGPLRPEAATGMVEFLAGPRRLAARPPWRPRRVALQMIQNTIVCAPDGLRDILRAMTRMQLIRTLAAWRPDLSAYRDVEAAYRISLRSLARRYLELHDEIADLDAMIGAIVDELAPNLIARNSIGHTGAAQLLLTAGDNPERLRSEASFAALCGVSPIPALSGKTVRHRLNRGGDRHANSALHIIAIGRLRTDPKTKTYVAKRVAEGTFKTRRDSSLEALPRSRGVRPHHARRQKEINQTRIAA